MQKTPEFRERDFHVLATCLARTINGDNTLYEGLSGSNRTFIQDLQIERLYLLMKIESACGHELQRYISHPEEMYDMFCKERDGK